VLAKGLTPEQWWLRCLLIASNPCGPGFFHEVGTKLLVEIGPEGGCRHNSPLTVPLSSEGKRPEAPLGDEQGDYGIATTFAAFTDSTLHPPLLPWIPLLL
jgi:hypothetical protein